MLQSVIVALLLVTVVLVTITVVVVIPLRIRMHLNLVMVPHKLPKDLLPVTNCKQQGHKRQEKRLRAK